MTEADLKKQAGPAYRDMDWFEIMDYLDPDYDNEHLESLIQCPNCHLVQVKAKKCKQCRFLMTLQDKAKVAKIKEGLQPVMDLFPNLPCYEEVRASIASAPSENVAQANKTTTMLNSTPQTPKEFEMFEKMFKSFTDEVRQELNKMKPG